jgi:hypothetical protein
VLSTSQGDELVAETLADEERGTLIRPVHVPQLAERMAGRELGVNRMGRCLTRHSDKIVLHFRLSSSGLLAQ